MSMSALEEQLRESACYGDVDAMVSLLQAGVNVNSANAMNGWTPLHWAYKRGDVRCKDTLLSWGADINIRNKNGETPINLETTKNSFQRGYATHQEITQETSLKENVRDGELHVSRQNQFNDFVPNYLQHPELNHKVDLSGVVESQKQDKATAIKNDISVSLEDGALTVRQCNCLSNNDNHNNPVHLNDVPYEKGGCRILKIRIMKSNDCDVSSITKSSNQNLELSSHTLNKAVSKQGYLFQGDFIEVDIPIEDLTMKGLIRVVFTELQVASDMEIDLNKIYVRKLPNTRLRRNIEITRLKDYQEIEIGLLKDAVDATNLCLDHGKNSVHGIEDN